MLFHVKMKTFGEALQVPLEKTFFKQLQSKLIAKGIDSQTINGGTGSWGTDQELTFYRQQGYKYKPDITLLFFFTRNDTVNNYDRLEVARNGGSIQKSFYHLADDGNLIYPFSYDPDAPKPDWLEKRPSLPHAKWLDTADWLWLNSHLYRWAVPYVRDMPFMLHTFGASGILGGEGHIRAFHPTIPIPFFVYQSPPTETWQNAWQLTEAIIADLAYQVEQDNGKFVVIIIPAKEQVYPQAWQRILASHAEMQAMSWDLDEPNQQLIDILQRHDIPYFDLLPVFMDYHYVPNKPSLYFHHDGHWNEAGHELTAEAVLYFLFKSRLVY
ncbi:MAG: hypothetical protein B6242_08290 [Anaerolineaceae bacterium 4572_78]|nr:MAG: hypothetical protein B6242_08290 [Anaerolineaceae bacterium 4572_78]